MTAMTKFKPPSLKGKVAIVTGGNRGMGFHIVQQLANHGAKVYMASRSESAAAAAISQIEAENPELDGKGSVVFLHLDLSTVAGAQNAAERFLQLESKADILVHNAALMSHPYGKTTDGLEDTLAVNHFAPFAFTRTLLPLLISTSKQPSSDVRVITVSSAIHARAPPGGRFLSISEVNETLASAQSTDGLFGRYARYARSKLANILFAKGLQKEFDSASSPALSIAVNPGGVATETVMNNMGSVTLIGPVLRFLVGNLASSPLDGAAAALYAATSPDIRHQAAKFKGAYLDPHGKISQPNKDGQSEELVANLWAASDDITTQILSRHLSQSP
ncbi:NAD(P)-binding protein [Mycena pura]|uniref:NAD(P)-binding protein n=1 Tax=Mycena pura TaxID=153505 RepID=A0AAD6YS36_9AGAR|nr:NAD(P)-binding protein [Mycena pura]